MNGKNGRIEVNNKLSQKEIPDKKDNIDDSLANKLVDTKNLVLYIIIIGTVSFFIRIYYFPFNIPITLDGLNYFLYAIELSESGQFPNPSNVANNGWSIFLSVFFSIINLENFLDYMHAQRFVSIIISTITIIPIYYLCNKFFNKFYSLIGVILFAFEPHIIQNSLLGLTEPLYILLGTITILLFLNKNKKIVYTSFVVAALFSLVRFEGLIIIFSLSIMFFVRFKTDHRVVLKYLIALSIFILVLLPMAYIRNETIGNDGLLTYLIKAPIVIYENKIIPHQDATEVEPFAEFVVRVASSFFQYIGWISIPYFIIFIPYGIIHIFKNRNVDRNTIIVISTTLLLPALYAYTRYLPETRYLYIIFPIFCIVSLFTIQKISNKIINKKLFTILIIGIIIISSVVFLEYKKINYENEMELIKISDHIIKNVKGSNVFQDSHGYLRTSELFENWAPSTVSLIPKSEKGQYTSELNRISPDRFQSLEEFVKSSKNNGLTHLIISENKNYPDFLLDVFFNEENYPYLIKEFDSTDQGFENIVKIYKIDYDVFELPGR